MNRMTGVTFPGGSVSYGWDSLGRRTSVTRGNGTSTQFAYEDDSDLDWMRHVFAGGATASAPADSWMGIDYGYDASGRLTLMASTDSRIMGSLPAAGSYGAANALNQVAAVPGRAAMTWSDAGNLATDGRGWSYTHDEFNRLIRAQSSSGTVVTHGYDTDGIRMETVLNPTGSVNGMPTGGTRTRYVTSQTEEVADLDGNRAILRRYIPGPAIDERAAQVDANGAVTYIHTDRQSSVIALSDSAGNVVSRRAYGSYGETTASQIAQGAHPFGYTGRRYDATTGLYYYRARWYEPETGTFLQTDPIGSLDYVNLYAYVGLEPGNATDPTGMWQVSVGGSVQGYEVVGSGASVAAGLSYTRQEGLQFGATGSLQGGGGSGAGAFLTLSGGTGNLSDNNGNELYGEVLAGPISFGVSRPIGAGRGQMTLQGASRVAPASATRVAPTGATRARVGVGVGLGASAGVRVQRSAVVRMRPIATRVASEAQVRNANHRNQTRHRLMCGFAGSRC